MEVTESQAQRISVASLLGHLSLSVRSAEGIQQVAEARQPNGTAPAKAPAGKHQDPGTVWAVDVSPALGVTNAAPPVSGGSMRVFQGAADVKEFKF